MRAKGSFWRRADVRLRYAIQNPNWNHLVRKERLHAFNKAERLRRRTTARRRHCKRATLAIQRDQMGAGEVDWQDAMLQHLQGTRRQRPEYIVRKPHVRGYRAGTTDVDAWASAPTSM